MDPFTTVESWSRKQDATSHLAPSRQEPFIGVQPPNCVEAEADTRQTKLTDESNEEKKKKAWRGAAKNLFEQGLNTGDVSGDAPDGMQWAHETCGDYMKNIDNKEYQKEAREHPTLPSSAVRQIVKDHAAATADNQSGASGNISTSGGGMELGPLKMKAPDINAGGQADKETIGTVTKVAGVAAGNPAAAIADDSRKLGGQIMYDSRYAPLSPNKGKMAEGVAGTPAGVPAVADGFNPIDTALGLAAPAVGFMTGNPVLGAGTGLVTGAAKAAMKGEKGDILGESISGGLGGGVAGIGGGMMGMGKAASAAVPPVTPPGPPAVPLGETEIGSGIGGDTLKMHPPAPAAPPATPAAPPATPAAPSDTGGAATGFKKSLTTSGDPLKDLSQLENPSKSNQLWDWDTGARRFGYGVGEAAKGSANMMVKPFVDSFNAGKTAADVLGKTFLTDISDGAQEDAADKFLRIHTSEEEMLNNAIPGKKKSPPPEDLKEKINTKQMQPGAENKDKMLLTSSGCKQ